MIRNSQLVYIHNDHLITGNVMTHVVYIINDYIITEIATDNSTIVQTHRQPDVMKRKIKCFQFPNPYETKEFAVLYEFGIESVGNKDTVPIIRCVPVSNEHFYFVCC